MLNFLLRFSFVCLIVPACTWAAPVYRWYVTVEPASTSFSAPPDELRYHFNGFSFSFELEGELPPEEVPGEPPPPIQPLGQFHDYPTFFLTGLPRPDATVTFTFGVNDPEYPVMRMGVLFQVPSLSDVLRYDISRYGHVFQPGAHDLQVFISGRDGDLAFDLFTTGSLVVTPVPEPSTFTQLVLFVIGVTVRVVRRLSKDNCR